MIYVHLHLFTTSLIVCVASMPRGDRFLYTNKSDPLMREWRDTPLMFITPAMVEVHSYMITSTDNVVGNTSPIVL